MKKILVILLVIGLMLSGAVTIASEEQENSFQGVNIVDQNVDNTAVDPAPYGGGGGGGGGSPG